MARPTVFARRLIRVAALPGALVLTAALITASSYSVFTSATTSPGNSFSSGSVVLKNDSSGSQATTGSALFTVTGLTPTSAATVRCVTVQSTGTLPALVKLYVQNATASTALSQYLTLKVEVGTATSTSGASCSSFSATSTLYGPNPLSTYQTSYTSYANGLSSGWTTSTPPDTRAFRITVSPDPAMPNSAQGQTTSVDLVWEADTA